MTRKRLEENEIPTLEINETFRFPDDVDCVRLNIEWTSKENSAIVSDLDMNLLCYDERARFIEKVDDGNTVSKDESCLLINHIDSNGAAHSHLRCVKIDFRAVKASTSSILIFMDGGPRNFQFLQTVNIQCSKVFPERAFGEYLPSEDSAGKNGPMLQVNCRTRRNYQGLVLCVLYKDGWNSTNSSTRWVLKPFMEPFFTSSKKEKEDICGVMVVNSVPSLEKYRPHLFASINDICVALSSRSLPKLKKKFQKNEEGLPVGQFTEVLFRQLYETHPRILDDSEAPYAVAMLEEMFHQIDYNGDSSTNWDEFTTFCVQTGVVAQQDRQRGRVGNYAIDEYVIEYGEELLQRDRVLSAYRLVSQVRHVRDNRRLLVIPEESDNVLVLDEKFRVHAQIYPSKVQIVGTMRSSASSSDQSGSDDKLSRRNSAKNAKSSTFVPRAIIYDCIYLSGRDMYCYCSSDHSITVCKELSSLGGKKVNFIQHNRFYHSLLHMKLCWSGKHDILCSAASDRTIYGWNIDDASILFQIARHSDNITDFICVDAMDLFITCGMDRRIVLWSSVSRRVKGVLLGHKRGVRCIDCYENTLLSAGFELNAKTWDIASKDCVAMLRGHRYPIVSAKLMCERSQSDKEHRAITVDEGGEFRLWNIYVRERATDPVLVPTLQIFQMTNPETPLNDFRFLFVPYNPKASTSYYSDLIACSTKLMKFLPEKNVREFIPPFACKLFEVSSAVVTAVGKSVLLYDLGSGRFSNVFQDVSDHDISALCMDGERGRRMYVGNSGGDILLINSTTGAVIDKMTEAHTREITAILQNSMQHDCLYTSSMDGHIRMHEETNGQIRVHNFVDFAFGEGVGVSTMRMAPQINVLAAASTGKQWGLWHDTSFKKLLVIHEQEIVTAIEVVGCSRDKEDNAFGTAGMKPAAAAAAAATGANVAPAASSSFSAGVAGDADAPAAAAVVARAGAGASSRPGSGTSKDAQALSLHSVASSSSHPASATGGGAVGAGSVAMSSAQALSNASSAVGTAGMKENILTLAVAMTSKVVIYTFDASDLRGIKSAVLLSDRAMYITDLSIIRSPEINSVNYSNAMRQKGSSSYGYQIVASTDDGQIALWDTSGLRLQWDARFRRKFTGVPVSRKRLKHLSSRQNTLRRMSGASTVRGGDGGGTGSVRDDESVADSILPTHRSTGRKSISGASVSSAHRGSHSGFTGGSGENATIGGAGGGGPFKRGSSAAKEVSSQLNNTFPYKGPTTVHQLLVPKRAAPSPRADVQDNVREMNESRSAQVNNRKQARAEIASSASWVELRSEDMFALSPEEKFDEIASKRVWNAHNDSIPFIVPIHSHGCMLTVSHDGYHRMWNLDSENLGEMQLPNVTEQMKLSSRCKEPGTRWRFILEKIPVTQHHVDIAHAIRTNLRLAVSRGARRGEMHSQQGMGSDRRLRGPQLATMGFKGFRSDGTLLSSESENEENIVGQDRLRRDVLKSLTARPSTPDDVPPTRIPTKEEKDLLRLSLNIADSAHNSTSNSLVNGGPGNTGGGGGGVGAPRSSVSVLRPGSSGGGGGGRGSRASSPGNNEGSQMMGPLTAPAALESSCSGVLRPGAEAFSSILEAGGSGTSKELPPSNTRKRPPVASKSFVDSKIATNKGLVNRSFLGSNTDSLMMSYFGAPSLWYVPGDKDIWGNPIQTVRSVSEKQVPPAFSDISLYSGMKSGLIDVESQRILRKVGANSDSVSVYERSQPKLLLRSPYLTASVQLPALDNIQKTEICFGAQKDMYRNAEKLLNERENMSKTQIRNAVTKTRIESSVRRVTSMIHLIQPPSHDEVILPKNNKGKGAGGGDEDEDGELDETGKVRTEEQRMKLRLLKSAAMVPPELAMAAKPLDRDRLQRWVSKVRNAETHVDGKLYGAGGGHYGAAGQKKKKKREMLSAAAVNMLEKKLQLSIRGEFRSRLAAQQRAKLAAKGGGGSGGGEGGMGSADEDQAYQDRERERDNAAGLPVFIGDEMPPMSPLAGGRGGGGLDGMGAATGLGSPTTLGAPTPSSPKKAFLTTRMLLPYYKLENVTQFMDIFAKVDENFSGDLDVNEWIKLFTSLDESISKQEARMIFMKIDKDSDGFLTMRELIPVVFNRATKEQQKLIVTFAEMELTKKHHDNVPKVTKSELESLFEAYDTEHIGFVNVSLIKERIKTFHLSEQALFFFFETVSDLADDEMVNLSEFSRIFKPFTTHK